MDQLRPTEATPTAGNSIFSQPTTMEAPVDKPQPTPITKTVDINNIAPETNKFKINIFEDDIRTDFLKVKSHDAKPDADMTNINYVNPDPNQPASVNGVPNFSAPGGGLVKTKESLRSGVRAALMVVDYVISYAAMKIAGDTKQTAYTPDAQQKKLLEDVLVEYLYTKQTEMPIWLTLAFAVAGSYGVILVGAGQRRYQINKNQKANTAAQQTSSSTQNTFTPPKQTTAPQYTKPMVSQEDMIRFQNIKPPTTPPKQNPILKSDTEYREVNGVMVPHEIKVPQSYSEILNPPAKSSPDYPDPNIIAETPNDLRDMVARGVYPMYRKNGRGKPLKVQYDQMGNPKVPGKPSKMTKTRYGK
jgi:hypothetical protein